MLARPAICAAWLLQILLANYYSSISLAYFGDLCCCVFLNSCVVTATFLSAWLHPCPLLLNVGSSSSPPRRLSAVLSSLGNSLE
ncbi:hypothetical protein V1517DRAFT_39066 [Lipomyces orientalis]|uniref:Uncharacterized protein n=1 Tax=Lipomyces orientalis TaxID=1233043 RepID=A0ACC3TEY3_9ASCO